MWVRRTSSATPKENSLAFYFATNLSIHEQTCSKPGLFYLEMKVFQMEQYATLNSAPGCCDLGTRICCGLLSPTAPKQPKDAVNSTTGIFSFHLIRHRHLLGENRGLTLPRSILEAMDIITTSQPKPPSPPRPRVAEGPIGFTAALLSPGASF